MKLGERVRAVRLALGLTQEGVAEAAGVQRVDIVKIEGGDNAATSWRIRSGLAQAFGVNVQALSDLLDGLTDVDELVALARSGEVPRPSTPKHLRERSEWAEVAKAARDVATMTDPQIPPETWGKVGELYDNPSIPAPLTPRVVLHLARAVSN